MPTRSISPKEAQALLAQKAGHVYLDVRTVAEFAAGHPTSAVNVPLVEPDPSGMMALNPDFLRVVRAHFAEDAKLLVGCMSGGRSLKAAEMLEQAGFREVINVRCGFGGERDARGRVVEPGWAELGLPVEQESRTGASYETLRSKIRR
ncbi:MAG TPA: rhodanese-like domain-containing protein [Candidatus Polarisedimenticolia bacterium]|nr:rhodanese-like domain-containing protein [Candidatus Polarisedimenticolia bacterium]